MKVYILQHEHEVGDASDAKLIGVYGTPFDAAAARDRLSTAPGFRDHRDGFSIDAYELGEDHWAEGFHTEAGERQRTIKVRDHVLPSARVRRNRAKA